MPIESKYISGGTALQRLFIRPPSLPFVGFPVVVSLRPGCEPVVEDLDFWQFLSQLVGQDRNAFVTEGAD
jgi:hypothetical protein